MSVNDQQYSVAIADGLTNTAITAIKSFIKDPLPTFQRMIVLETIQDPTAIDERKIDYWANVIRVSNIQFSRGLARNTIIAQRMLTGITEVNQPMFFLPFFPSHLSLPCKPGEIVWTMFEDPNARIKEMGFWFCKVTAPHFVDDVNHTHFPSQLDHSFNSTIEKEMKNKNDAIYELRNGKVNTSRDGIRFTVPDSEYLSIPYASKERAFETLLLESDAALTTQYEAVPRFKKRPGDVALEGSNNTLIVLGTDRAGPISENLSGSGLRTIVPTHPEKDFYGNAGTIDIVAGRGMLEKTGGTIAPLKSILNGETLFNVIEKKKPVPDEGDPDYLNDRSRILLSQKTKPDAKFEISDYLKDTSGIEDSEEGDAAVVIKSDKIRIIARSDISFIVTDYSDALKDSDGSVKYKKDSEENENWASITIRRNGDIIFTPGSKGVIKLGGDDADQAILCTEKPASVSSGEVSALPIASTGGGFVGTADGNIDQEAINFVRAPDLGSFSTKVLIK